MCSENSTLWLEPVIDDLVERQGQLSDRKKWSQDLPLPTPQVKTGSRSERISSRDQCLPEDLTGLSRISVLTPHLSGSLLTVVWDLAALLFCYAFHLVTVCNTLFFLECIF